MIEDIRIDLSRNDFPLKSEAIAFLEKVVSDRGYLFKLLHRDGMILKYAPAHLKDDEELVKIAVEQNPQAAKHASKRLRAKYEIKEILELDKEFAENLDKVYNEECSNKPKQPKQDITEILVKNLRQFKTYFEVIDAMSNSHKIDLGDNVLALRTSISQKSMFDIFVYFDKVGNITDVAKVIAGTQVPSTYKNQQKVDDFAKFNDLNL